jgi:hypothetical protein
VKNELALDIGASERSSSPVAVETTARSRLSAPGLPLIAVTKLSGGPAGRGATVTGGFGWFTIGTEPARPSPRPRPMPPAASTPVTARAASRW